MLSYRHSYHAGNFADIIKHIALVEVLNHLTQKETPFEYIDTHCGAGLFNLGANDAQKLQEYKSGIAKLLGNKLPELSRYLELVSSYNPRGKLEFYPGSPAVASCFLRPQDRAWLYELHPQDYKWACSNMKSHKKIKVFCQDGLEQLNILLPPITRRGLILIDPSYELKSEYEQVITAIVKAYKKFSTGIYVLWYPVVERARVDTLENNFIKSGIKNIQRFELGVSPDSDERGMTASGVFVINPPWKLYGTMSVILPEIASLLGDIKSPYFKCDVISAE